MTVLRASDYRRMRWKNGGGETAEIVVVPEEAGLDDFLWRVSMATVETGGPFSSFPGVDRTLAVLDGRGVVLDVDGRAPIRVTPSSEPVSFRADVPTTASLIGGPVTDLNVMTRRGLLRHFLRRYRLRRPRRISFDTGENLLFCRSGRVRVSAGNWQETLGPRDALLVDPSFSLVLVEPEGPADIYHIELIG